MSLLLIYNAIHNETYFCYKYELVSYITVYQYLKLYNFFIKFVVDTSEMMVLVVSVVFILTSNLTFEPISANHQRFRVI